LHFTKHYNHEKISLLFTIIISISFTAIDRLTHIDIYYSADFTIPSTIKVNLPFNLPVPKIKTNINKKLANEQTNKELIEQLFVRSILLTMKNPIDKSFNFLNDIDLYLKTETQPKVKLPINMTFLAKSKINLN
jgi:hypothetical protein